MYLSKIRLISFALSAIMALSPTATFADESESNGEANIELAATGIDEVYTANFANLVKNGAETEYTASSEGVVTDGNQQKIVLDDFTSIYLTDTYGITVGTDGKVSLAGDTSKNNNKNNGAYVNGAYVEFTAPSDGTVKFAGTDVNYYIDGNYKGYGASNQLLTAGQKLQLGTRKDTTAVSSLSFEPKIKVDLPVASPYTPTKTTWTFDDSIPAEEETDGVPYITGQAEYNSLADGGEIKFPSAENGSGSLIVNMATPIKNSDPQKNNVKITFDVTGHSKALGQQLFEYSVKNSEGFELIKLTAHPYDNSNTNILTIGGKEIAKDDDIRSRFDVASGKSEVTSTVETAIDYYSREITVTIKKDGAASGTFTGDIPEDALQDVKEFVFTARRSKTAAERYISFDNLTIEEYTSTAEPANTPTIADGYTDETIGEMSARVKAPAEAAGLPLLIYLCGSARFGTDNYSQLYNAQYLFNAVGDKAILIAPQTDTAWNADVLKQFIEAAKTKYSAEQVIVAGQGEGADAAYALADTADKIIPIGGVDPSAATAATAKVWAFADYADANITKIRTAVNALQSAGKDITYTEFPFEESKSTAEKAAEAAGLIDWITTDVTPQKTVDLVLFAGQSNMAGRGEYAQATPCLPGHGYEFHAVTNPKGSEVTDFPTVLSTLSEPFGKYENNNTVHDAGSDGKDRRSGDMVSSFIESYYSVSGVPIVGVQCSRGGEATDYFKGDNVAKEMAGRYKTAEEYLEASGYTVGKKFMVWCQGETDAEKDRTDDQYKSNTRAIFDKIKTDTGITNVFMVRIGHCKTSGATEIDVTKDPIYKRINLAQKSFAEENDDVTAVASLYTDEYAEQMRDQYHYHQPVYNSVGNIAGNNAAVTLYPDNDGEWTEYPEPEADEPDTAEGTFEITSSDAQIDVSALTAYGADTYRVYKADKSYVDVKATDGKVENPKNGEVTVVPVYRFNLAETVKEGYTSMRGAYSKETGYGTYGAVTLNADGAAPESGTLRALVPSGRYDITVTRKGQTRFNVKNDDYIIATNNGINNGHQNRANDSAVMYAPQILTGDDTIDLSVSGKSGSPVIETVEIVKVPDAYLKPVVYIAGNSESANYYPNNDIDGDLASNKIMMTGFGMMLPKFLTDDYKIYTLGEPSATIKVWANNYKDSVLHSINADDTILVDFGINEVVSSSNRISEDEMKTEMAALFTEVKAKGAKPILVSPVSCGKYQDRAYFRYVNGANDAEAFAQDQSVSFIDLNRWTEQYIAAAARETGTEQGAWEANNYHVADDLHMTQHGALLAASFIAAGMKDLGYKATDYSYTYTDISSIGEGNIRGAQTENKRVYSVAAASAFMTDGTITKPSDAPEPTNTPGPGITPEPSGTPEYPVTVSYDATAKTLTLTAADNTAKAAVIKAAYEGGKMSYVKVYPDTAFTDKTAVIENIEIGENDKIFVWDSLAGMKPLSPVFTAAGAPEITQKLTEKPTADPDSTPKEYKYRQDFEGSDAQNGWTSPAGTLAVKSDPTSGIGKYMTVVSGKSGTCRSGYVEMADAVNQSFVFECDYKSTSNANVSDLELLESKSSVYANHGRYSNAKYAFTMARPMGSDLYVINNGADDSGFKLESYADPVFKSKEIAGNPWLHVKVVGDMESHTATAYITSLDGQTEYYHGMTDMSPNLTSWKCIHLLSPSTGADTCIDNIEIYKARESDLAPVYHKIKITCKAYSFEQYVHDGESVVNIPDVSSYGQSFDGWNLGGKLYSSTELAKAPITSDCEIVGQISAGYIEAMAGIEFNSFPAGNEIVMGADENTYGSNPISLTITGEQGTSLVTNPDSRVNDFNVEWTFDGFRILDGMPTGETDSYCEHYGAVEMTAAHNTAVDFKMKQTASNYYGRVTAVVTYNGKTLSVSRPLLILGTKGNEYMLPKPGYTADYNKYEDTLVGYKAEQNDLLLGGWESYGSDSTSAELKSDSTGRYLSISRAASGNSSVVYNRIGDITVQTVFEQDVRFGNDGAISYVGGGTMTEPASIAFTFEKSGTAMKFNGTAISGVTAAADKWYHVVIHADPTSRKCFAKVYEKAVDYSAAQPIGQTAVVDFQTYTSGAAYRISPAKTAGKSIDINNAKIYAAEIDESKMNVVAADTASIPSTVTLTVSAKTAYDADAIGKFEWSIADELAEGVSIESTGDNTALLKVTDDATAGDVTVRATIGGKSVTKAIKLTGKAGISFTEAPAGIRLGGGEYTYKAVVMNADASVNSSAVATYSLANAQGTEAEVSGVSIDSVSGKLTIGESVTPQTIYVKASSGGMTKLAKTVLYDLKFSFGTNAAASGFTAVPAATAYSDSLGFGIEGGKEDADVLTGGTFKLKLEKGMVYEVKATYSGTITCERIDSDFIGFTRTKDSVSTDTYQVAIFGDDIMDVAINGTLKSIEVTPVVKSRASKPDWWTIGDSTIQQNGSWAYTITGGADKTSDLSKYPRLAAVISTFHNSGRAGRQHMSYYNEGLLNAVLCGMNPGDAVSISGMGTNDSSSTQAQFKAYDKMYMNAILDMGGYVILGSYTPSGNYGATEGKVYDSDTMMFKGKRTNAYELAIRELYYENKDNPKVLGFLDIGQIADDKMTADIKTAYENVDGDESVKREAADAKAAKMMAWWKDYNHYYVDFSNYILPDLTKTAAELIEKIS